MQKQFMDEAIALAKQGVEGGHGGPFGAVVVKGGVVIGRGFNKVTSCNDPTAHAEVTAIREACQTVKHFSLEGCEIYTSCEPCPMCLGAIYWARLSAIYCAATRKDAAANGFDDEYFYQEIAKAPQQRQLHCEFVANTGIQAVFNVWSAKEDKVEY